MVSQRVGKWMRSHRKFLELDVYKLHSNLSDWHFISPHNEDMPEEEILSELDRLQDQSSAASLSLAWKQLCDAAWNHKHRILRLNSSQWRHICTDSLWELNTCSHTWLEERSGWLCFAMMSHDQIWQKSVLIFKRKPCKLMRISCVRFCDCEVTESWRECPTFSLQLIQETFIRSETERDVGETSLALG